MTFAGLRFASHPFACAESIVSIANRGAQVLDNTEHANRLADDLETLRTGALSEREFRAKWQMAPVPELFSAIWPNLEHYLADLDVRERDPDYRAMQDTHLSCAFLTIAAPDSACQQQKLSPGDRRSPLETRTP